MASKETTRNITYRYQDGLYINFTNRCPTACRFCIKFTWKMKYRGYGLKLGGEEPAVSDILSEMDAAAAEKPFKEIVFCGYGESTYRLADLVALGERIKRRYPGVRRRLNTIGLGNMIHKRSIAGDLQKGIDAVSVSLNTADPEQWGQIHNPLPEFEQGFPSVLEFIRECAAAIPDTTATAVAQPEIDVDACRELAQSLGARFRERPLLDEYEAR